MTDMVWNSRYAGRESAWHRKGVVVPDLCTASEGVKIARLDYTVQRRKIPSIRVDGYRLSPSGYILVRKATEDDPQPRDFGVCGKTYYPIQNRELAKILDPLTEKWKLSTCGALDQGKVVFFCLEAGKHVLAGIPGEDLTLYWALNEYKDGRGSIELLFTPVREVCANTVAAATEAALVRVRLRHTKDAGDRLGDIMDLMGRLQQKQVAVIEEMEAMARRRDLVESQIDAIIQAAWPGPDLPGQIDLLQKIGAEPADLKRTAIRALDAQRAHEANIARMQIYRIQTKEVYKQIVDEQPALGRTPYAAYMAVVDFSDFGPGRGDTVRSTLIGDRSDAKRRGYAKALSFSKN